jgi:hypothetical protein
LIDGYQLPLDFKNGFSYLQCRKTTNDEVSSFNHIIMTSDLDWDPRKYDKDIDNNQKFHDPGENDHEEYHFDQHGEYRHCTFANHHTSLEEEFYDAFEFLDFDDQVDDLLDTFHPKAVNDICGVHSLEVSKVTTNYELLCLLFGCSPANTIKRTFAVTTQYERGRVSNTLKQHWRLRFPACNVKHRNEPVATDTVFSDTPAVDCGVTAAQIFVGCESLVADVYGLKMDKEFG